MGGRPKGLLVAPSGDAIVTRTIALCRDARLDVVFVGDATAYTPIAPDVRALADDPPGIGPLGALCALLAHATSVGARHAVAIACDMPYVTAPLLSKLLHVSLVVQAAHDAPILAPRRHDGARGWEPLFARYEASRVLAIARARALRGAHALQGLLDDAGARELILDDDDRVLLRDWDTPGDTR